LNTKQLTQNDVPFLENKPTHFRDGCVDLKTAIFHVTISFTETKLLALDVLPREQKFNQDHFLTATAPELSKENSNAKRRVDKKQLVVHIGNSMCYNGRKIQEYFTRGKRREFPIQFTRQISHRVAFGSSLMQNNE
jgi:hypothetical protein